MSSSAAPVDADGQSVHAVYTNFRAPTYDSASDFEVFERDVALWQAITALPKAKQGAILLAGVSGAAKKYCSTLATADILSNDGVDTVMQHLQTGFGATESMKFNNRISDWLDFVRTDDMSMTAFLCGYQTRMDNLKAINLPAEIQGHLMLRQGLFDNTTKGLIIASAGGSFEIDKLVAALKGLYPEGAVIPAPTAVSNFNATSAGRTTARGGLFCDHCNRRNHTKADCWAFMRANGQAEKANEMEAEVRGRSAARRGGPRSGKGGSNAYSTDDPATFYMSNACFSSVPHAKPSGIVDTGAFRTLIGEDTLLSFMSSMNLDSVNVIPGLTPQAHRFGVDGPPISTSFRATLPWQVRTDKELYVFFNIAVDVLPGQHPLLLGLPTLVAMKAALNFGGTTGKLFFTMPNEVRHCVDLDTSGTHPCILFSGETRTVAGSTVGELVGSQFNRVFEMRQRLRFFPVCTSTAVT